MTSKKWRRSYWWLKFDLSCLKTTVLSSSVFYYEIKTSNNNESCWQPILTFWYLPTLIRKPIGTDQLTHRSRNSTVDSWPGFHPDQHKAADHSRDCNSSGLYSERASAQLRSLLRKVNCWFQLNFVAAAYLWVLLTFINDKSICVTQFVVPKHLRPPVVFLLTHSHYNEPLKESLWPMMLWVALLLSVVSPTDCCWWC